MPELNDILNELQNIEEAAKLVLTRCYNTKKKLERFYAPASPKGKKKGMTPAEREKLNRFLAKRDAKLLRNSTIS